MTRRLIAGLISPCVLVLAAVAMFWRVWPDPVQTVVGSPLADVLSMFYPVRAFANQQFQSGSIPLWNPYILCGHPFHAEGQGAIFYPLNLALAWLPAALSMNFFAVIHFAAAGVFFFLFLRASGMGRMAAFAGGFIYMFSSAPVSRFFAGHFTIIPFLALVPGYLWAWQSWCRNRSWGAFIGACLFIGCMILAGYPQMLLYSTIYFGWLAIVETAGRWRAKNGRKVIQPVMFFAGSVAVGACLGAIQLLPSYVFAGESFRQQISYDFIASFSFAPENLITLIAPRFFGGMGSEGLLYWGRNYLWEMWIYIGIVPLALALMAIVSVRTRLVFGHATAVLLFLVLALGKHTPLHRLLYEFMPFFNYFRGSSKFSFFVVVSLTTLGAAGVETILQAPDSRTIKKRLQVSAGTLGLIFLIGGVLLLGLNPDSGRLKSFIDWRIGQGDQYITEYLKQGPAVREAWAQAMPELLRAMTLALAGAILTLGWRPHWSKRWPLALGLILLAGADLVPFAAREFPVARIERLSPHAEFLYELKNDHSHGRTIAAAYERNSLSPFGVETPLGYVGNMTRRYNNFLTAANGLPRSVTMATTFHAGQGMIYPNVKYLILAQSQDAPESLVTEVMRADNRVLYQVNDIIPRAYFAYNAIAEDYQGAMRSIESKQISPMRAQAYEAGVGADLQFDPPVAGDEATVIKYKADSVLVRTRTLGPRLLVLTDSYAAGWRCILDGVQETPIYPVNIAFRGVVVPAGEHEVKFEYRPNEFRIGTIISGITIVIILMSLLVMIVLQLTHRAKRKRT